MRRLMMVGTDRLAAERSCAYVGAVLLSFPAALQLATAFLLAAALPLAPAFPLAIALTAALAAWVSQQLYAAGHYRRALGATLAALAVAAVAFLVEAQVYDGSWDGNAYHALALDALAGGWNPWRQTVPDVPIHTSELTFFTKGPWLLAATVQRVTGSFEGGKAFGLYFMGTAFLLWLAALLAHRKLRAGWALLAAFALAVNPVSATQLFTFYVDGQLASLLGILLALLILTMRARYSALLPVLAVATALVLTTKLNGALYAAIIAGGFWAWRMLSRGHARRVMTRRPAVRAVSRRPAARLAAWLATGVAAAALTVGFNPYVRPLAEGTITAGNPFHPHAHYSSIINLESAVLFPEQGRVERMARSLLARPAIWPEPIHYQIPFVPGRGELSAFAAPDVRVGGFGPLFSGGLVLAGATLLLLGLGIRGRRARRIAHLVVLSVVVTVSVLAFGETWWARLGPQLAFVPLLLGVAGLLALRRTSWRIVPAVLVVVLALNSALVGAAHALHAWRQSGHTHEQLSQLAASTQPVPLLNLAAFPGLRLRLERAGVQYQEVVELPCPAAEHEAVGGLEVYTCALR
jgi:hypothetical protein